jgi:H+-translocating NAD(P) transhydrogenase subunit alpha
MQLDAIRKTQLRSAGKPPHIFNCLGELTVIIGVVRESKPGETRVAATPATVKQLLQLGYEVVVEPGAGDRADFPDQGFVDAGATIGDVWKADVVFGINTPSEDELDRMKPGATLIALLQPMLNPDIVEALGRHGLALGRSSE